MEKIKLKLYKLHINVHRSSDLFELAIVTDEEWEYIKAHIGYELYFGEVAGKHSEVTWVLNLNNIEILSEDKTEIALFEKWFPEKHIGSISLLCALERVHETIELPCILSKYCEKFL